MRRLLEDKGTWNAIARDSDEYGKAKREAAARKLDKLSKQLGQ